MSYSSSGPPTLTHDAVLQMARTLQDDGVMNRHNRIQPIMQVIHCSKIKANNGAVSDRLKVILSDTVHFISCMYGKIDMMSLADYCYVRITDFMVKTLNDRIIIIILAMEVVHPPIPGQERIGTPIDIEKTGLLNAVINGAGQQQQQQQQPSRSNDKLYNNENSIPNHNTNTVTPTNNTNDNLYNKQPQKSNPYQTNNNSYGASNLSSSSSMMASPVRSSTNNPYGGLNQKSHVPIQRNMGLATASHITPISSLNMYNNKWTIQGRITNKADIKTWSNSKGEGSLFSIEILDAAGSDIRATFFKEAVDKFYNMIEMSKIYTFTGGKLKVANMQYNTCKSSYEISFDQNAEIHAMPDEGNIKQQQYNFITNISEIEMLEANKTVDVCAVIKHVGECTKLLSKKSGQELMKNDLTLIDDSNIEISFTLWGNAAEKAASLYMDQPIVAIRRARVSDYGGGKSLGSSMSGGGIDINPMHLPEAKKLHNWWVSQGSTGAVAPARSLTVSGGGMSRNLDVIADRSDILAIKEQNMGYNNKEKGDYLTIKGYCTFIKKDKEGGAWYTACPNANDPCRNMYKVTQSTDGTSWECMKCGNHYPKPVRRWIFSAILEDTTSSTWVSFFNEQAEVLLGGMTADNAFDMTYGGNSGGYDGNDGDGAYNSEVYDSIFYKASCQEYYFCCKVKNEINNETNESRIKTSVVSIAPVDYLKESLQLLQLLE